MGNAADRPDTEPVAGDDEAFAAVHRRYPPVVLRRCALAIAIAALVAAGPALAAAGVFSSGLQVSSSSCSAAGGSATSGAASSCTFGLSDGRRFACPQAFAVSRPTAEEIERAKSCVPRAEPSFGAPSIAAGIAAVRGCLESHGISVRGGPVSSADEETGRGPAGELVVGSAGRGAITAFYADSRTAGQLEPAVVESARRFGGQVERRAAVTTVWVGSPPAALRTAVRRCLSG